MTSKSTLRLFSGPGRLLRSALLAFAPLAFALGGCATPLEGMEKEVKPADLEALKATGAKAGGLVVWTSSRDGLPHLFSMKTDGSETKQLTKGDTTDWRPRFSPDGSKILFMRSRDTGFVRESDANANETWDLYTIASDGGPATKVVENGAWGSWSGPEEIVFVRGTKIMHKKLGAATESRIMDTARYPMFDGATIQQPEVSQDGHFVALTLAGTHRQAGIWNIKKKTWTAMGQGTQIAWAPDGASVYWADDSGKDRSRIVREPVVAGMPADERDPDKILFVDLGGKRSRERFPHLSNEGKWLVFAAAVNDLENDLDDFELFLWEVGSSPTTATRLTFHSANDRWPDIFIAETSKAPAPAAEGKEPDGEKTDATEKAAAPPEGQAAKAELDEAAPAAHPQTDEEADESAAPAAATKPKGKKKKHR
jgi:Tol biopolymer transport system component